MWWTQINWSQNRSNTSCCSLQSAFFVACRGICHASLRGSGWWRSCARRGRTQHTSSRISTTDMAPSACALLKAEVNRNRQVRSAVCRGRLPCSSSESANHLTFARQLFCLRQLINRFSIIEAIGSPLFNKNNNKNQQNTYSLTKGSFLNILDSEFSFSNC